MKIKLPYRLLLNLFCCVFCTTINAQESGERFTIGNLQYVITDDVNRTVDVSNYTDSGTEVEVDIPSEIIYLEHTYAVTGIGTYAFNDNSVSNIIIPHSVIIIRQNAFRDTGLNSVTIGSSVETIELGAFYYNSLTTVTIPASVTSLGKYAFGSNSLENVTSLSDNPAVITNTFTYQNYNLSDLSVPEGTEQAYINAGWTSGFDSINGDTTSLSNTLLTKNNVSLYPNPTTNVLNLKLDNYQYAELNVYSFTGKLVKKISWKKDNAINVDDLDAGVYLLNIVTSDNSMSTTFIKK